MIGWMVYLPKNKTHLDAQTVDKFEKRVCLQFFSLKNVPVDFRNPFPFRRLSAKPHQSKRLRRLGQPIVRQECRKFLQSSKGFILYKRVKNHGNHSLDKALKGILDETISNPILSTNWASLRCLFCLTTLSFLSYCMRKFN
jgi:hypothetical protein